METHWSCGWCVSCLISSDHVRKLVVEFEEKMYSKNDCVISGSFKSISITAKI